MNTENATGYDSELFSELRDLERRIGVARNPLDIRAELNEIITRHELRVRIAEVPQPQPEKPTIYILDGADGQTERATLIRESEAKKRANQNS